MQTIRLSDPWRGRPARQLQFGTSEWAADSCLVEWSTLERQWLGPMPAPRRAKDAAGRNVVPLFALPLLASLAAAGLWLLLA